MTHLEFGPYHNFHIRFGLSDGTEFSGVLTNTLKPEDKPTHSTYAFIPTRNMREWKEAEREENQERMRSLTLQIDIANIVWAERIMF